MRRILCILMSFVILLCLILAVGIGILLLSADGRDTKNVEELYYVVNEETALSLDEDNAEVVSSFTLGLRDRIYIIEFDISDQYNTELKQSIVNNGMWVKPSQIPSQKLKRYIFDYVEDFQELEKIASLCDSEETYLYLQVHEDNKYSMEFSVTAWDASEGVLHYFRMDT